MASTDDEPSLGSVWRTSSSSSGSLICVECKAQGRTCSHLDRAGSVSAQMQGAEHARLLKEALRALLVQVAAREGAKILGPASENLIKEAWELIQRCIDEC